MLSIADEATLECALNSRLDDELKHLLRRRCDQLGGDITDQAHFVIVQPADTAADLEKAIGFSIFQNPADGSFVGEANFAPGWEWAQDHGFAYELCFIMDDSGFGHVVIIPKEQGADPELVSFCRQYASEHF